MAADSFAVLTAIWQHFVAADSFAVLTAIRQHWDLLTGGDATSFTDNEPAARATIKGDSRLPVVGAMAMCVQLLLIRYNIAVWFAWVDSDSNLADGLGRDDAEDSWALKQNWELHEFQHFPFAISLVSLWVRFPVSRVGGAGNTSLVGDGTSLGRGHGRYPNECRLGALAVLHPGVPVMWHTDIRDLSPTAEAVRGAAYPR